MIKKIFEILIIVFTSSMNLYSAFEYRNISVESAALGEIKTVIDDESFGCLYNPANIGGKEIGLFYTKFYDVDELPVNACCFSWPVFKDDEMAFGYYSFGTSDFYEEKTISAAYKLCIFKNINLGIALKSLRLSLGDMRQDTTVHGVDFAGKIICSERVIFGFLLSNVNRPEIGRYYKEEIYRDMNFGCSYLVKHNIKIMAECVKQVGYKLDNKLAIESSFFKRFFVRIGNQNNIDLWTFGLGMNYSFYRLDYAYNYHFDLGGEHFFSLKFCF